MADFEQDPRIAHLLNTTGREATRFIQPQGVRAVQTTVRHRRRNRIAGVAVLAAVALAGGPVAMNLAGNDAPIDPPAATTSPSAPAPTTTAPSVPASTPATPADHRISANALRNATLTIPAWPAKGFDASCPSGKVRFTGGTGGSDGLLRIEGNPIHQDVDHDGSQETVALVSCNPQGSDYKVLAFRPDPAGAITTVGQVVASAGTAGHPGDIKTIWSIQPAPGGQIRVDVGDYRPCCAMVQASQHQWRTYGWSGGSFRQTGGPDSFGPNPKFTDLRATSNGLTMTEQANGSRTGTLTVTIRNEAAFATPDRVLLQVGVPGSWKATATGCTVGTGQPLPCTLPAMPKGATRTVTLTLTAPAGSLPATAQLYLSSATEDGGTYPATTDRRAPEVPITRS